MAKVRTYFDNIGLENAIIESTQNILLVAKSNQVTLVDMGLGAQLAVNGNFSSDTGWTKGAGWTIAAGQACSDGTQIAVSDLLNIGVASEAATVYELIFKLVSISAGSVTPFAGDNAGTARTAVGTYVENITATDTSGFLLQASIDFVGCIEFIEIREIL